MPKHEQLAIQFYTLRDFCKTASDLAATCKKVRDIGYESVQVSGVGPIEPKEISKILADHGLRAIAAHDSSKAIITDTDKIIERNNALGVRYTCYPWPDGVDFTDLGSVDKLCADLNRAGAKLREAGITLCYHNHDLEFYRLPNGKIALEYIYEKTSPENLQAEIDTFWVQAGGGCPIYWSSRYKGRAPLIHLKDATYDLKNRKLAFAEIGRGTLDWASIIPGAEAAGTRYFIVEQDTCPGDPFESIRISYDYLTANFFKNNS